MENTTQLFLIRHAQTDFNSGNLYLGKTDVSINKLGVLQAKLLKKRILRLQIDIFFTSSAKRAMQTVKLIKNGKAVPVIIHSSLSEINFGIWEGLTYKEVLTKYPYQLAKWEKNPLVNKPLKGETMSDVLKRVSAFLDEILSKYRGKNIAVVSSGGFFNILICSLFQIKPRSLWQFSPSPASISKLCIYPDSHPVLALFNDTSHLN